MNRLILKYKYFFTFAVLAVLAWAIYRQLTVGSGFVTEAAVAVIVWILGTFIFIYFWPRIVLRGYKKATLVKGFGDGPIPINTLYTQPQALFADPLHVSLPPGSSQLMSYGTNRDTLYTVGVLDLSKGPQVLHVPDMADRYYAVQFTDPSDGTNFAYVGKRTMGTKAGEYLIAGPNWREAASKGMTQISSPNNSVLVIGRVFVENDSDIPAAYALAKKIQLKSFDQ
ncbi:MAG TPA: DUF1254 domain-containing protein [Candidatus Paceibacterota bacterium]|nr:DUF1254 domain-containing protein [Candidatus Paceibacterota bacterium]